MGKVGVLLVNLGTPKSPSPSDVWRYLIEFLTDEKVIDSPWLMRQLLVRGAIVPRRYKESARQYREIWMEEGSPLMVYGQRVRNMLQDSLGEGYQVELAMRYQEPSIPEGIRSLSPYVERILLLPLFPQYADATTGSIIKLVEGLRKEAPPIEIVKDFPTDPGMIEAFAATAYDYDLKDYDQVLFSFHGLPERQLTKIDPNQHCLAKPDCCQQWGEVNRNCYSAQCYATAEALREKLGLSKEKLSICFQSRLGRDPWIQPFTDQVIINLAKQGKKRLLVFCPAFVCDCLETLYEVRIEYRQLFREHGGEELHLVPGLNDHPKWVEAIATMVQKRAPLLPKLN